MIMIELLVVAVGCHCHILSLSLPVKKRVNDDAKERDFAQSQEKERCNKE